MTTDNGADITLAYPDDWTELEGVLGSALAVLAPEQAPTAFRANLNVVVQTPDRPQSATELRTVHADALAQGLGAARVIDASETEVDGREASRALVTYSLDGDDITLEQWMVPVGERTIVLSASCTTSEYAAVAGAFQDIVASVVIDA